jgi:hypothetical protein
MNVRKIHLPFKLSNLTEAHVKESGKASQQGNPDGPHINPRVRAYGKARLDIARRVQTQQDWDALWRPPTHTFPFSFSTTSSWKQCLEYRVDDFAAEIGFWIDILGLQVNAFGPDYVQFSSPGGEFTFAVTSTLEYQSSTPPGSMRIQFFVQNLLQTVEELERRSLAFDQPPAPQQPDSVLYYATFSTPHGIPIDLWGEVDATPGPVKIPIEQPGQAYASDKQSIESRDSSPILPDKQPSLDLYTWDDAENDPDILPEVKPSANESAVPVTSHSNWPVSPDITAELTETRRTRHISEDITPYSVESFEDDPDQDELTGDPADRTGEAGDDQSPKEDEYPETITYEPID